MTTSRYTVGPSYPANYNSRAVAFVQSKETSKVAKAMTLVIMWSVIENKRGDYQYVNESCRHLYQDAWQEGKTDLRGGRRKGGRIIITKNHTTQSA